MNYIYIYAAIAIAYQAFKFIRARQKAAIEAEQKAQKSVRRNTFETISTYSPPKVEERYIENYEEEYVHPVHKENKYVSYENADTKPLVESVEVKAYQIPNNKKAAVESRFEINKTISGRKHPLLKSFKTKSEVQKAFVYAEVFKTKF